jgi:UDP-N-acetylglucosamine--N-acetylmuramyl-(pentapeptide) pyrophosphoryl-undecaprenol N-acetylglucosamine transferase
MPEKTLSFLLSGGGTGGHIFPALSIADELKRRYPNAIIHFVGASDRMEMEKVPAAGYSITGLWISGINRSDGWKNISFPLKLSSSLLKSIRILTKYKPAVVIGTGGFASGALLYAAHWLGHKTLIQEQNSFPGITNKWLAPKVNSICVAFEGLEKFFPKSKIQLTGNPIRKELINPLPLRSSALQSFGLIDRPTLLVLGGSLGARNLNKAVKQIYPIIIEAGFNLIWQTGKLYIEDLKKEVPARKGLFMEAFLQDMSSAYSAADLVLSRAGAGTLSELAVVEKAAILVPSPNVAEDHQTKNAEALVQKGAALMIAERDLETDLESCLLDLLRNEEKRKELSKAISEMAMPNATKAIVDEIEKWI